MTTVPDLPRAATAPTALLESTAPGAFRPVAEPRRGLLFFLTFAAIGGASAQMGAALLTLALKATEISADGATSLISLATGAAGILTILALPVIGKLSDRSGSRLGRRRPYLLLGAICFAVGGVLLVLASDALSLTLANLVLCIAAVCVAVTAPAIIADQIPSDRRGPASAMISLSTTMGALLGIGIAQIFSTSLAAQILVPTALAVVSILLLVVVLKDPRFPQRARTKVRLFDVVGVFWVNPLRHPDFALAFGSRMLVFTGVAAINGYQAIYLIMHLGFAPQELAGAILLVVVLNCVISLLLAPLMGKISDRIGRRKPFIVVAAVILAAGLFMAAFASTFALYLVAVSVVAVGQGVYFSVELALATQVLPDADNPAKDLALISLANNLPISLVAAIAPLVLAIGVGASGPASNFGALFIVGAVSVLVGGFLILFIRTVR